MITAENLDSLISAVQHLDRTINMDLAFITLVLLGIFAILLCGQRNNK